jgi:hypothetical protein
MSEPKTIEEADEKIRRIRRELNSALKERLQIAKDQVVNSLSSGPKQVGELYPIPLPTVSGETTRSGEKRIREALAALTKEGIIEMEDYEGSRSYSECTYHLIVPAREASHDQTGYDS